MAFNPVEVEDVHYQSRDIAHVANQVLSNFTRYGGLALKGEYANATLSLWNTIRDELPRSSRWHMDGLDIVFTGFPRPVRHEVGDRVVYYSNAPRFVFERRIRDLCPSKRSHIEKVTDAISDEMVEVYKLRRRGRDISLPQGCVCQKQGYL